MVMRKVKISFVAFIIFLLDSYSLDHQLIGDGRGCLSCAPGPGTGSGRRLWMFSKCLLIAGRSFLKKKRRKGTIMVNYSSKAMHLDSSEEPCLKSFPLLRLFIREKRK